MTVLKGTKFIPLKAQLAILHLLPLAGYKKMVAMTN